MTFIQKGETNDGNVRECPQKLLVETQELKLF